jgi:hypothetical protein
VKSPSNLPEDVVPRTGNRERGAVDALRAVQAAADPDDRDGG